MVLDTLATYLNIDKGALLAPLSVMASSILGAAIAMYTIYTHRKNLKLKNSMDFIDNFNKSELIGIALVEVNKMHSKTDTQIQEHAQNVDCDEYKYIRTVLNFFESMAICISRDIYDDTIIKEAVFTTVTNTWRTCKPFVEHRRKEKNNKTFFQELENLCLRWESKPLKSKLKSK